MAEERLNRHKHYGGFPALAVKACLDAAGAKITDVQHVAVGQDSDANLTRKVQYALANPAKILNFIKMRQRKESMRDVRSLLAQALDVDASTLKFQEHHLEHHIAHIASAYYCSPWEKAAGFSYDGSGDFVSTMMARCEGPEIHVLDRVFLPHSLGSFYTMICDFIGYRKYGDEGKVMGLAPYGKDTYVDEIRKVVALKNGSFQLNLSYFKPLGQQSGNAGAARRNRAPGAAFLRQDGKALRPSSRTARRNHAARHGSGLRHATLLSRKCFSIWRTNCTSAFPMKILPWREAARSTAWPTANCFPERHSAAPGFSRPPAMKAWRSAPRCTRITRC